MKKTIKQIYKNVRKHSPSMLNGYLAKLAFTISGKPFVKKDTISPLLKFPNQESGGLIISADFELSWAFRYSKRTSDFLQKGRQERHNFPLIISLLEKHNVPITWATVGHLFLDSCKKVDHDRMTRIPHFNDHWKFTDGDWFDHDPNSDFVSDPEWYAPDLVNQILKSPVTHEIGCHTFSHLDCSYKNCPPDVLDDELNACSTAAEKFGIKLKSFVFPGGTSGNYEILKKHGYLIYRKKTDIDLAYPYQDKFGTLVTPTSYAFGANGANWSQEYLIYRYKKYIDKAIKTNTIAHLWFHPSIDEWTLKNIMPGVLEYAAQKREQGKLWIGTMEGIADHIYKNKIYKCQE